MNEMDGIRPVGPVKPKVEIPSISTSRHVSSKDKPEFKDILLGAVAEVQKLQEEADTTIKKLVTGEVKDVTEVMVAVQKADTAFQTLMAVRNKVITAYEEIMRMQI